MLFINAIFVIKIWGLVYQKVKNEKIVNKCKLNRMLLDDD